MGGAGGQVRAKQGVGGGGRGTQQEFCESTGNSQITVMCI